MVAAAQELGLAAIALCDRDGLYGSVRAHSQAKELGQQARRRRRADAGAARAPVAWRCSPWTTTGYRTSARCSRPRTPTTRRARPASSPSASPPPRAGSSPSSRSTRAAAAPPTPLFGPLRDAFGDRLFVAAWRHLDGFDAARLDAARRRRGAASACRASPRRARSTTTPRASRSPTSSTASATRRRSTRPARALAPNAEARLRSGDAHARASSATARRGSHRTRRRRRRVPLLAARARATAFPERHALRSPGETRRRGAPPPRRTRARAAATRAGRRRAVRAQIEKELALIARHRGRAVLPQRPADRRDRARRATSSARAAAAPRTAPSATASASRRSTRRASNLLFERFLSAERREPPDIDVDFEHERREEVIQDIYETLRPRPRRDGARRSSRTAARARCARSARSSASRSSRSTGSPALVIHGGTARQALAAARVVDAGLRPERRARRARSLALAPAQLEGFPRHLSIHVGGFVLSRRAARATSRRSSRRRCRTARSSRGTRTTSTTSASSRSTSSASACSPPSARRSR